MKLRLLTASLLALSFAAGNAFAQAAAPAAATTPAPDRNALSYALGYQTGRDLIDSGESIDLTVVQKALQDGYAKKDPAVPVDQLRTAVETMQKRQGEKAKAEYEKAAADNKARSDAFLAQNKTAAGVATVPGSTVQYKVLEAGKGAKPTLASNVQLEVAGPFPLGQRPQQAQPARPVQSIKVSEIDLVGLREALVQMPAGSKWEITLPYDKAYGADPRRNFPPNLAVSYEVKLVAINPAGK